MLELFHVGQKVRLNLDKIRHLSETYHTSKYAVITSVVKNAFPRDPIPGKRHYYHVTLHPSMRSEAFYHYQLLPHVPDTFALDLKFTDPDEAIAVAEVVAKHLNKPVGVIHG